MTDEITRLYEVASDGEATVLDELRERAGVVWTHSADDHTWTNPAGKPCEQCGALPPEQR